MGNGEFYLQKVNISQNLINKISVISVSPDLRTIATGFENGSIGFWDMSSNLKLADSRDHLLIHCDEEQDIKDKMRKVDNPSLSHGDLMAIHQIGTKLRPNVTLLRPYNEKFLLQLYRDLHVQQDLIKNPKRWQCINFDPNKNGTPFHLWWDVLNNGVAPTIPIDYIENNSDNKVTCAAFSPNGATMALAVTTNYALSDFGFGDSTIHLIDLLNKTPPKILSGHKKSITCLAFHPDSNTLISGSCDKTVRVWDVLNGKQLFSLAGHSKWVIDVAFSPDRKTFASVSAGANIRLWNLADGKCLWAINGKVVDDLKTVMDYIDSQDIDVYDEYIDEDDDHDYEDIDEDDEDDEDEDIDEDHIGSECNMTFSPDGRILAIAISDRDVFLFNSADGSKLWVLGHDSDAIRVAFSADGDFVLTYEYEVTDDFEGAVHLWEVAGGRKFQLLTLKTGDDDDFASFSPDGSTLAVASNLWKLPDTSRPIMMGHQVIINCAAISPDGNTIASGMDDGSIYLWDLNGEIIRILNGHTTPIQSVVFGTYKDLDLLASGSREHIRIWDMKHSKNIWISNESSLDAGDLCFSEDGRILMSIYKDQFRACDISSFLDLYHDYLAGNISKHISCLEKQIGYVLEGLDVHPYPYYIPNLYGNNPLLPW